MQKQEEDVTDEVDGEEEGLGLDVEDDGNDDNGDDDDEKEIVGGFYF